MLARDDGFDLHPRCTQRFDDATREGNYFDCAQCSEKVLDLSSLTPREYARWRERPRDGAKATRGRAAPTPAVEGFAGMPYDGDH